MLQEVSQSQLDRAYRERNMLVALLSKIYPAGIKKTAIEGWDECWHNCVYIDLPTGQASWHYHDNDADLFDHLLPYIGKWDGHTTEQKYTNITSWTPHNPWIKNQTLDDLFKLMSENFTEMMTGSIS